MASTQSRGPARRRSPATRLAAALTRAVLAAVVLVTAGCTGADDTGGGDGDVDQVTFITALGFTGREGYAHVAAAKGYFADERLNVAIKPGAAGDSNLRVLAAGQAQFATIDYAGAVVRAGTGEFDNVRAIVVLQQKTMIALMSLERAGIRSPRDLVGRTVAHPAGSVTKTLFPAYAKLANLTDAQIRTVKWVDAQGPQLPQLLAAGKVDAIGQFVAAAPTVRAAAKGTAVTVLAYGDYMTDLYGNVVVARTDTDQELRRRFVRALFKGLVYAVEHPDEAGRIIHAAAPATPAEGAAAELRLLRPYVGSPQADPEMVARSIALMYGIGMIPAAVPPDRVFDFTVAASAVPTRP